MAGSDSVWIVLAAAGRADGGRGRQLPPEALSAVADPGGDCSVVTVTPSGSGQAFSRVW